MSLLVTEAIVLHRFDYLESSRIYRLATRDGGVRSVLARGARRSKRRFSSAIDLFAHGTAEIHTKGGRDLDTLSAFDVTRARPEIAADLARFAGASAIAEIVLHFARGGVEQSVFDALAIAFEGIATAGPGWAREATLAGAWTIVAELGFAPGIDECGECHAAFASDELVMFSHVAGRALCSRCATLTPRCRRLPAAARRALGGWLGGERSIVDDDLELRAHQRMLREFLQEHLLEDRPLRAYETWEHASWSAA